MITDKRVVEAIPPRRQWDPRVVSGVKRVNSGEDPARVALDLAMVVPGFSRTQLGAYTAAYNRLRQKKVKEGLFGGEEPDVADRDNKEQAVQALLGSEDIDVKKVPDEKLSGLIQGLGSITAESIDSQVSQIVSVMREQHASRNDMLEALRVHVGFNLREAKEVLQEHTKELALEDVEKILFDNKIEKRYDYEWAREENLCFQKKSTANEARTILTKFNIKTGSVRYLFGDYYIKIYNTRLTREAGMRIIEERKRITIVCPISGRDPLSIRFTLKGDKFISSELVGEEVDDCLDFLKAKEIKATEMDSHYYRGHGQSYRVVFPKKDAVKLKSNLREGAPEGREATNEVLYHNTVQRRWYPATTKYTRRPKRRGS